MQCQHNPDCAVLLPRHLAHAWHEAGKWLTVGVQKSAFYLCTRHNPYLAISRMHES